MFSSGCPGPADLSRYLLGNLAGLAWEAVDAHVGSCPSCAYALSSLPSEQDRLVELLRHPRPPVPERPPHDLQQLLEQAKSWQPPDGKHSETQPPGDTPAAVSDPHPEPAPTRAEPAAQAPVPIGGGCRLVQRIGSGGFGEVWRAEAPGGVEVAVKIIFRPLDDEESQRELHALELMKRLRHPFLLPILAYWPMADRLYILMELADHSLWHRLKECQQAGLPAIPAAELAGYFREAAEALDYLHQERVLHRDIKPENLLLLKRHVKVADFGLARLLETQGGRASGCGTPGYMAPEVWRGSGTFSSDQYSLAASFAELRLGRHLFTGRNAIQVMREHLEGTLDLSGLDPAEEQVLRKALARDPQQRYPSCSAFVEALAQALRPSASPPPTLSNSACEAPPVAQWRPTSPGPARPVGRQGRRGAGRRARLACGGVLLALGTCWAVWQTLPRTTDTGTALPKLDSGAPLVKAGDPPTQQEVSPSTAGPEQPPGHVTTSGQPTALPGAQPTEPPSPLGGGQDDRISPSAAAALPPPPTTLLNPVGRPDVAPAAATALAAEVKEIFRTRCFECHGGSRSNAGVKVLDRDLLVRKKKIVPGRPEESRLLQLVQARDETVMPPQELPRLGADQVEAVRRWLAAGAPNFPEDVAAPVVQHGPAGKEDGADYVLKAILAHVRGRRIEDRPFFRYFSLHHLLAGGATRAELDLHRDALAKAINHLSWSPTIVRPEPIDGPTNSLFVIDLRQLGWHEPPRPRRIDEETCPPSALNLFDLVLLEYPYGVVYEDSETFDHLVEEFLLPARPVVPVVYVRADWFVSVATQPPLYEDLLQLPSRLKDLEARLGVEADADVANGTARRAGLAISGVSHNNRVVERHPARYGAYWKSFDFRSSKGDDNIFRDPLHLDPAGGEVIFNLPNGLQGYLLVNGKGERVEQAPIDIVTDRFAADKTVRNGLACMRCHEQGMKSVEDAVRPAYERLPGSAGVDRREVLRLYPEQAEVDRLLRQDTERFTAALERALARPQGREPLTPVAQRFLEAPLPWSLARAELGVAEADGPRSLFRLPPFAPRLLPLASEGVVRRDLWEDSYDQVLRRSAVGIPIVPLDGLTRRDFRPDPPIAVGLATNKKKNSFEPGGQVVISVTNSSDRDLFIELIGTSTRGDKVVLSPASRRVRAGEQYCHPPLQIRGQLGKEQISLFACETEFPAGKLEKGEGVADRVVHPFYELRRDGRRFRLVLDPARVVKTTIDIESR